MLILLAIRTAGTIYESRDLPTPFGKTDRQTLNKQYLEIIYFTKHIWHIKTGNE
jgi:hypothetical protein